MLIYFYAMVLRKLFFHAFMVIILAKDLLRGSRSLTVFDAGGQRYTRVKIAHSPNRQ
jgi:hypothetical protein